jgi:hypothetical protein
MALSRYAILSWGALAAYYTFWCDQLASDAVAQSINLPIVPPPADGGLL